ncbi:MAG: acyl-CoA thioesterase [Deltaproteobacteria bacterium]|nr:acyl-CoA thioesterase [Deltaproteobacteria bacterium]
MLSHVVRLRVRWVDTDASGIIHYTAAFRYFEVAEWEFFRKIGILDRMKAGQFGLPRVSVNATFRSPLRVDEEIAVHIRLERIGTTSLTLALEIFRGETQCIAGAVTVVFTDAQGASMPIPDEVKRVLTAAD